MSQAEVVATIASALSESEEEPLRLIREIVEEVGEARALELLGETRRIEDGGGMFVARGTRRRSPGGVFFKIAKDDLPKEAKKRIFRAPRPPKPPTEPSAEPDRVDAQAPQAPAKRPAAPEKAPRGMPEIVVRPRRRIVTAAAPEPPPPPAPAARAGGEVRPLRAESGNGGRGATAAAPAAPPRPVVRERVLVRVAPQADVPAKTLDEAIERGQKLLSDLGPRVARAALLELIDRHGGLPEPEPESEPPESEPPDEEPVLDPETLRQNALVSVVRALRLRPADLARVLYGNDTPALRRKAKALLDADDA